VGEQVVGQQDGLGVLQVGAPRHDHAEVAPGLAGEGFDNLDQLVGQADQLHAQVGADEGGDLVVPGPAGPQPSAQFRTHAFPEGALEAAVDVLVGLGGDERSGGDIGGEPVQGRQHGGMLGIGEQAGAPQRRSVRTGTRQIVPGQPPVELGGPAQRGHGVCRAPGEPAAPQASGGGRVGHRVPFRSR